MNDQEIEFQGPYGLALLQDRLDKIFFPSNSLRSLQIDSMDRSLIYEGNRKVESEFLDRILSQDIYDAGLEKIAISFGNV